MNDDSQNSDVVPADGVVVVRKRDLALSFAKEAAVILAVSATKVVTRTAGWGATGLALAVAMCGSWAVAGVLPADWRLAALWLALALIGVTGGLGYVGWIRGLGRAGIHVGCELGMVQYLVGVLLDRTAGLFRKSTRVASALDKTQDHLSNLPLHRWETTLTTVVEDYLGSDDPELGNAGGRVGRFFRRFIVRRIQRYLLRIVRQEIRADGSGGGVSVARVRSVAIEQAADKVTDMIEGLMFQHLAIGLGVTTLVFVLPFVLSWTAVW